MYSTSPDLWLQVKIAGSKENVSDLKKKKRINTPERLRGM
jgi:hypothetical protein